MYALLKVACKTLNLMVVTTTNLKNFVMLFLGSKVNIPLFEESSPPPSHHRPVGIDFNGDSNTIGLVFSAALVEF